MQQFLTLDKLGQPLSVEFTTSIRYHLNFQKD